MIHNSHSQIRDPMTEFSRNLTAFHFPPSHVSNLLEMSGKPASYPVCRCYFLLPYFEAYRRFPSVHSLGGMYNSTKCSRYSGTRVPLKDFRSFPFSRKLHLVVRLRLPTPTDQPRLQGDATENLSAPQNIFLRWKTDNAVHLRK